MNTKRFIVLAAALVLMGGIVCVTPASAAATSKKAMMKGAHQATGTVSSMIDTEIFLMQKHMNKEMNTRYLVNSSTKKIGIVDVGAHVVIQYKMQGRSRVATQINGEPRKSTEGSKATTRVTL